MKRSNFHVLGILLLVFAAGCSSSTISVPTPQVNYVQGQAYIYYAQVLDKNTGDTTAGSGDTITSVVLATGMSYQGMTGVTEIQNSHTNPVSGSSIMDTTYIAQSNGNYYHYNYGLESLNDNPAVLGVIGKPVAAGWILQAEFSASPNATWVAADTTITVAMANVTLRDSATEGTDSTIVVGDTIKPNEQTATAGPISIFTKHSMHDITVSLGGATLGNATADTYVSSQYGPVLDIVHPSQLESQKAPGRRTILIQVP
jgi:hypothetical protein